MHCAGQTYLGGHFPSRFLIISLLSIPLFSLSTYTRLTLLVLMKISMVVIIVPSILNTFVQGHRYSISHFVTMYISQALKLYVFQDYPIYTKYWYMTSVCDLEPKEPLTSIELWLLKSLVIKNPQNF